MNTNQDTTLTNQDALFNEFIISADWVEIRNMAEDSDELAEGVWQAATKASESEINSLKQRVGELSDLLKDRQSDLDFEFNRAEQNELECNALTEDNIIMRDTLNKIALGHVYDADIIESAGDCLQRLSNSQSLAEHDNDVIERIATALENAEGELKTLPEYVALVRKMKHE